MMKSPNKTCLSRIFVQLASEMSDWPDLYVPSEISQILLDLGFNNPTEIQRCVLPAAIRARSDVLGAAPTGSGKTLAFGIPMIIRIIEEKKRKAALVCQTGSSDLNSDDGEENEITANLAAQQPSTQRPKASKRRAEDVYQNLARIEELDADTGEVLRVHSLLEKSTLLDTPSTKGRIGSQKKPSKAVHQHLSDGHVYGLVFAPTRELAMQIYRHLKTITDALQTEIQVEAIVGGMSIQKQSRLLRSNPDILIATPGRLWHLIQENNQHVCSLRRTVNILVVDEADRLVEANHFEDLRKLFSWLNGSSNDSAVQAEDSEDLTTTEESRSEMLGRSPGRRKRQTMVFSATLTFVHQGSVRPGGKRLKHREYDMTKELKLSSLRSLLGLGSRAKVFDLSCKPPEALAPSATTKSLVPEKKSVISLAAPEGLQEYRLLCPDQLSKDINLFWFLAFARHFQPGSPYRVSSSGSAIVESSSTRAMIFLNSKAGVRRLAGILRRLADVNAFSVSGRPVAQRICVLHADMPQKQRLRALEQFQVDPHGVLVTSDVASRGLDLAMEITAKGAGVAWVVHFEVPHTAELYVHRRGRTARANNTGASLLFLGPSETSKWRRMAVNLARCSGAPVVDLGLLDLPDLPTLASKFELIACERIVGLAKQLDLAEHSAARRKANASWFMRAAREADIVLESGNDVDDIQCSNKRSRKSARDYKSGHHQQQQFADLRSQLHRLVVDCTRSLRTKPSGQQMIPSKILVSETRKRLRRLKKERLSGI